MDPLGAKSQATFFCLETWRQNAYFARIHILGQRLGANGPLRRRNFSPLFRAGSLDPNFAPGLWAATSRRVSPPRLGAGSLGPNFAPGLWSNRNFMLGLYVPNCPIGIHMIQFVISL